MYSDRDIRDMRMQGDSDLLITPGTDVYDINDDKVGTVHQYNPRAACLVVQKRFIVTRDLYIPTSAIARNDSGGIFLNLSKEDLKDERYSTWPVAGTTTAPPATSAATGTRTEAADRDSNMPVHDEPTVDQQQGESGQPYVDSQ
ncbi:MAG: hypothetical protein ACM3N4_08750 [Nitrososphaerota archaeon]